MGGLLNGQLCYGEQFCWIEFLYLPSENAFFLSVVCFSKATSLGSAWWSEDWLLVIWRQGDLPFSMILI